MTISYSPHLDCTVRFDGEPTGYAIHTTSVRDRSSESRALTFASHELVVVDSNHTDVILARLTSCTVRVDELDRSLLITLDDQSADLGVVGLALTEHDEMLDDMTFHDACDRNVYNQNFVVLEGLHTPEAYRGNGFGLTLLAEAVDAALESVRFATWIANAYEEPSATREARSDSLSEVYQSRLNAQVLTGRVLVASQ